MDRVSGKVTLTRLLMGREWKRPGLLATLLFFVKE